jgi:hypothetical protein
MDPHWAPYPCQSKADAARQVWRISSQEYGDLYVVQEPDPLACEEPLNRAEVDLFLTLWGTDPSAHADLVDLYSFLPGNPLPSDTTGAAIDDEVLPRLREAFEMGQLALVRVEPLHRARGPVGDPAGGPAVDAWLRRSDG